jgi:hypothetical protein
MGDKNHRYSFGSGALFFGIPLILFRDRLVFLCEEPGYNFLLSNATRPMVEVRYTFYSDIGYAIAEYRKNGTYCSE